MSLVSASSFIGGVKEYMFRGLQELPLVLTGTALLFTISSGSMAFMNLTLGMAILMPLYTFILQAGFSRLFNYISPNSLWWRRSTSDVCNIIPSYGKKDLSYYTGTEMGDSIPSYWLMNLGFFIGYTISNAVDSLTSPVGAQTSTVNYDKRNLQAIMTLAAISIFAAIVLGIRFYKMNSCEGHGWWGSILSIVCALGAGYIGNQIYTVSRVCGAKTSDLFGILSQILPASSTTNNPVVCTQTSP